MMSFSRINRSALSELIIHKKSHIISMILLGIAGFLYSETSMIKDCDANINWSSVFFFTVALIPLFFTCIRVFRDMHDVPTADVQMAMPLSSRERFLSRLMTICYIWIFPYIFFSGMGNVLSVLFQSNTSYTGYDGRKVEYASVPELFAVNFKVFIWGLSAVLFIIAVTVLCSCCIGSKAEAVYLPAILMIVISVLPFETVSYVEEKFVNVSLNTYSDSSILQVFGFGAVFCDMYEPYSLIIVLVNCILSLGLIALAMFAYTKRDAATVGYPVVFRVFFEILMILSLFSLFQTVHMSSYGAEYFALFIYFIGATILRIIVSRKDITPVKIFKWTGVFAGYYAAFILFSYLACITNGFGANFKKPDKSELSYSPVTVNVNCRELMKTSNSFSYENLSVDAIDKVTETAYEYIAIQNSNPKYFLDSMFTGVGGYYYFNETENNLDEKDKYYNCSIDVSAYDITREYHRTVFSVDLYLDKESAENFYRDMVELGPVLRAGM